MIQRKAVLPAGALEDTVDERAFTKPAWTSDVAPDEWEKMSRVQPRDNPQRGIRGKSAGEEEEGGEDRTHERIVVLHWATLEKNKIAPMQKMCIDVLASDENRYLEEFLRALMNDDDGRTTKDDDGSIDIGTFITKAKLPQAKALLLTWGLVTANDGWQKRMQVTQRGKEIIQAALEKIDVERARVAEREKTAALKDLTEKAIKTIIKECITFPPRTSREDRGNFVAMCATALQSKIEISSDATVIDITQAHRTTIASLLQEKFRETFGASHDEPVGNTRRGFNGRSGSDLTQRNWRRKTKK